MSKLWRPLGFGLALAFLALTVVNASWIAPSPRGYLKLVAHRGVMQLVDRAGMTPDTCPATRIEQPVHDFIENTVPSYLQAAANGAQMIEIDIAPTKDGKIALFHDRTLDCRTNGTGAVSDHTLAELRALDAGYGYTSDGGQTFTLRGKGLGLIPQLDAVLRVLPEKPLLYNLTGQTRGEAELLIAALQAAGRKVEEIGDGFSAPDAALPALRAAYPAAWIYSDASIKACTVAYLKSGWVGITPAACQHGAIAVPLNYQWAFAGWPNRLVVRMEAVGARVIVIGAYRGGEPPRGLDLPEQIKDVPAGFTGYLWVDDIYAVGPALHPQFARRTPPQEDRLQAALERRRKARE